MTELHDSSCSGFPHSVACVKAALDTGEPLCMEPKSMSSPTVVEGGRVLAREPEVEAMERSLGWTAPHERRTRLMDTCTVIEGHDGPVYVDSLNRFFPNPQEAFEALWDDGIEPDNGEALIHPCNVGKATTPNLIETIEEAWGEDYEDPDTVDLHLPKDLVLILTGVQSLVEKAAPDTWNPRPRERIALPPMPPQVDHRSIADSLRVTHGASPSYTEGSESGGCA